MLKLDIPDLSTFNKSLIVNFDIGADFMNKQLKYYLGMDIPDDKREWLYYMNMAGIKHAVNKDVIIKSLDTFEEFIMTKESILDHPLTRVRLMEFGTYFNYVSDSNSNQDSYIRGMLNPIPLNISTVAKNCQVLYYDHSEIGVNEKFIITKIEEAFKNFQDRWYMNNYTFEDRYVPTILAQCYSLVIPTVLNARISVLNTEKASMGHIREYLSSNLGIGYLMDYINDNVKLWLYKNIKHVMKHVGEENILESIIENVLLPSGIEILDIVYNASTIELSQPSSVTTEPWKIEKNISLIPRGNDISSELTISEDELMNLEFALNEISLLERIKLSEKMSLKTKYNTSQLLTKAFIIRSFVYKDAYNFDKVEVGLENWIYDTIKGRYRNVANITVDGKLYVLKPIEALYVTLYLMAKVAGVSTTINLKTRTVVTRTDVDNVKLVKSKVLPDIVTPIKNVLPTLDYAIMTSGEYKRYLDKVFHYHNTLWKLGSSYNEETTWNNIERVKRYVSDSKTNIITNLDVEKYLNDNKIDINPINPIDTVSDILKMYTGVDLDSEKETQRIVNMFKMFLSKSLSYNVQILETLNETTTEDVNKNVSSIRGFNMMKLLKMKMKPLEDPSGLTKMILTVGTIITNILESGNDFISCFGNSNLDMEIDMRKIRPTYSGHVIAECMLPPAKFRQPINSKVPTVDIQNLKGDVVEFVLEDYGTSFNAVDSNGITTNNNHLIRQIDEFTKNLKDYYIRIDGLGEDIGEARVNIGDASVLISRSPKDIVNEIIGDMTEGDIIEFSSITSPTVYLEATSGDGLTLSLPENNIHDKTVYYKKFKVDSQFISNSITSSDIKEHTLGMENVVPEVDIHIDNGIGQTYDNTSAVEMTLSDDLRGFRTYSLTQRIPTNNINGQHVMNELMMSQTNGTDIMITEEVDETYNNILMANSTITAIPSSNDAKYVLEDL